MVKNKNKKTTSLLNANGNLRKSSTSELIKLYYKITASLRNQLAVNWNFYTNCMKQKLEGKKRAHCLFTIIMYIIIVCFICVVISLSLSLQLLRHESFVLFSRALRCCCLLFRSCRSHLKLQLEVNTHSIYLVGLMSEYCSRGGGGWGTLKT